MGEDEKENNESIKFTTADEVDADCNQGSKPLLVGFACHRYKSDLLAIAIARRHRRRRRRRHRRRPSIEGKHRGRRIPCVPLSLSL